MDTQKIIYNKLEAFIKKYYTNEIIKGSLLFIGIGLLYFIFTLLVEHFLWLSTSGRAVLFLLFVAVELFLLLRFIFFPVFKLFKLQKGIDFKEASIIIGNHFTEVQDKLINFLQLASQEAPSELLLASIEQKGNDLQPIPFSNAIDFSKNKKLLPYASVPIIILFIVFLSGNSNIISDSFTRVVHFQTEYLPPAPFQFVITNSLETQQGKDFTLQVLTKGSVVPENCKVIINNEEYYLENLNQGFFQYTFTNVTSDVVFRLLANEVESKEYVLKVIDVPSISNFKMKLNYPSYLNRASEIISGNGNAIVPEGTTVNWLLNANSTKTIQFIEGTTVSNFVQTNALFTFQKRIQSDIDYEIVTSNDQIVNYERLNYHISIIKDQYPTITAQIAPDSLQLKNKVIVGQVADDYGISKLRLVYYDSKQPEKLYNFPLPINNTTVDQFVYTFPNGLDLQQGKQYEYYFEVFDNDLVNRFKSAKSIVFKHYELTDAEFINQNLKEQNNNINSLEKSIELQEKQLSELDKLQQLNKEKATLAFKDQKKIESFLKQQKQQEDLMKEFSKKLNENLEEFNPNVQDEEKKELQRRLDEFQKKAEQNEKLLKELEELSKKLKKDDLFDKVDKLKQNAKFQKMNLEQLVELTKRFYIEQKAEELANKLQELGKKQEDLPNDAKENTVDKQEDLNKEFNALEKELDDLDKENNELKSPLDIPNEKLEQKDIKSDMNKATEDLKKENQSKASPKQKSAGKKMQEMGQKMASAMASSELEQMQEDAKALRQILDNLLSFSFDEEKLISITKESKVRSLQLNTVLKEQQNLKVQFQHIDDSLFAVALRNPKITEIILQEVGEIHYNVDKSLETLSDNNLSKGASHQQYTLTSANKLADFLSNVQNDMQMQMQMQGSGKGKSGKGQGGGMQLPDIIKKQGELSGKMGEGMKPGQKPGDGQSGEKGKSSKPGKGGQGDSGSDGENGENGENGDAGKVLEILKEQQQLREALENELKNKGFGGIGQNALNQMKDIEKQLINKGFKNETLNKMLNLKHELLKLEKAIQQQGEDAKRKSTSNAKEFEGSTSTLSPQLKEYLNSIEILNRQSLPLQPNYNQKVQYYFKKHD